MTVFIRRFQSDDVISNYQELEKCATIILADDGNTVYNFTDKKVADRFSKVLGDMGIKGGSGNNKYVARHLRNNSQFGVVLTPQNLDKIFSLVQAHLSSSIEGTVSGAIEGLENLSLEKPANYRDRLELFLSQQEKACEIKSSEMHEVFVFQGEKEAQEFSKAALDLGIESKILKNQRQPGKNLYGVFISKRGMYRLSRIRESRDIRATLPMEAQKISQTLWNLSQLEINTDLMSYPESTKSVQLLVIENAEIFSGPEVFYQEFSLPIDEEFPEFSTQYRGLVFKSISLGHGRDNEKMTLKLFNEIMPQVAEKLDFHGLVVDTIFFMETCSSRSEDVGYERLQFWQKSI